MTEYKEINGSIVQDFARRTLANLRFIEENKKQRDVYEVTQLINSMLGLIVFPKEEFWEEIKPVLLSAIPEAEAIRQRPGRNRQPCTDLRQLVRCLRNSVSHFNIVLKPERGYIDYIKMWNEYDGRTNWKAEVNVFELEKFVVYFINGIIDGSLLVTPPQSNEAN